MHWLCFDSFVWKEISKQLAKWCCISYLCSFPGFKMQAVYIILKGQAFVYKLIWLSISVVSENSCEVPFMHKMPIKSAKLILQYYQLKADNWQERSISKMGGNESFPQSFKLEWVVLLLLRAIAYQHSTHSWILCIVFNRTYFWVVVHWLQLNSAGLTDSQIWHFNV